MISLRAHNVMDYVIGAVLVACPYIFGFSELLVARNVFVVLGLGLIVYSLFTDYYYSLAKLIPVGVHMTLDVLLGVVLILSPSIFNYRTDLTAGEYALHWLLGLGAMGLVAITRSKSDRPIALSDHEDQNIDIGRAA